MSFKGVRSDENYITSGKTIRQLIHELTTFENQDLEARMSIDGGNNHFPISILARSANNMNEDGHICILQYEGET